MPMGFGLYLCLFFVCASGVFGRALRAAGIRPVFAAAVMLLCAFAGLLEDIRLFDAVYLNLGGFLIPAAACLLLTFTSRSAVVWAMPFSLVVGALTFLFARVFDSALFSGLLQDEAWLRGAVTAFAAGMLCTDARLVVISAVFGFHLSELFLHLNVVLSGSIAPLSLGTGVSFAVCAALFPLSIAVYASKTGMLGVYRRRKQTKLRQMRLPEQPAQSL